MFVYLGLSQSSASFLYCAQVPWPRVAGRPLSRVRNHVLVGRALDQHYYFSRAQMRPMPHSPVPFGPVPVNQGKKGKETRIDS
jgi:hypothetical protein